MLFPSEVRFHQQAQPESPENNQFCSRTREKPLTRTTLMKWFPFQSDCATPASDWLPARYPLEIQGTDQPAGTDCDSRDCGRLLFFFSFLSDQNSAQNSCSEINSLSLHHRRVRRTLCIIKYVHSFFPIPNWREGTRLFEMQMRRDSIFRYLRVFVLTRLKRRQFLLSPCREN